MVYAGLVDRAPTPEAHGVLHRYQGYGLSDRYHREVWCLRVIVSALCSQGWRYVQADSRKGRAVNHIHRTIRIWSERWKAFKRVVRDDPVPIVWFLAAILALFMLVTKAQEEEGHCASRHHVDAPPPQGIQPRYS